MEYAFVANYTSGTVSVVNTATWTTKHTITVGSKPTSVATTANGRYAFVANHTSNSVSVITTATWTVIKTITVGTHPWGIATTANGKYVFVTNVTSRTLSVIATATWAVVHTVTVHTSPYFVATTATGTYAFVANATSTSVSVISTSSWTITHSVTVTRPYGIATTPAGKYVFATKLTTLAVAVISTSSWTVVHTVTVGTHPYSVTTTAAGKSAFVANHTSNSISVISTSSWTATSITIGHKSASVAVTPTGTLAFVCLKTTTKVKVVTVSAKTTLHTLTVGTNPYGASVAKRTGGSTGLLDFVNKSTASSTGTSSLSIPRPVAVKAGDLLLMCVTLRANTVSSTPTGWTLIASTTETTATTSGHGHIASYLYWKIATGSEPLSYSVSLSASSIVFGVILHYAANTSTPIDVSAKAKASTPTPGRQIPFPVVTTTQKADQVILVGTAVPRTSTFGTPPGTTERVGFTKTDILACFAFDVPQLTAGATPTYVSTWAPAVGGPSWLARVCFSVAVRATRAPVPASAHLTVTVDLTVTATAHGLYPTLNVYALLGGPFDQASISEGVPITSFVRSAQITGGRQHELQEVEATTVKMELTSRNGLFLPWENSGPLVNLLTLPTSALPSGTPGSWSTSRSGYAAPLIGGGGSGSTPCTLVLSAASAYSTTGSSGTGVFSVTRGTYYSAAATFLPLTTTGTNKVSVTIVWPTGATSTGTHTPVAGTRVRVSVTAQAPSSGKAYLRVTAGTGVEALVNRFSVYQRIVTPNLSSGHLDVTAYGPGGVGLGVGRGIVVTGTTGTEVIGFGYVEALVPSIENELTVTSTLSAADALSLFAQETITSGFYPGSVIMDTPVLYWRLGDPSSSFVWADATGNANIGVLTRSAVSSQATSALVDDLSGSVSVQGSSSTVAAQTRGQVLATGAGGVTIEFWARRPTTVTSGGVVVSVVSGSSKVALGIVNAGPSVGGGETWKVYAWANSTTPTVSGTYTFSGTNPWKHFVLVYTALTGATNVYVDNVLVLAVAGVAGFSTLDNVEVGGSSSTGVLAGTLSDLAVYPYALTQTTIHDHYSLGASSGWFETDAGTAVKLLLLAVGVPSWAMDIETGISTVNLATGAAINLGVSTLGSVLQTLQATEQGMCFQWGTPSTPQTVHFYNRHHALMATHSTVSNGTFANSSSATLHYLPKITPSKDALTTWNTIPTKIQGGTTTWTAQTVNSQNTYGRRSLQGYTATLYAFTETAVQLGQWLLSLYATPYTRVRSLPLSSLVGAGATINQQVKRKLLDLVTVSYTPPSGGSAFVQASQIEQISHTISVGPVLETEWQLTPAVQGGLGWFRLTLSRLSGPTITATKAAQTGRLAF